MVEPAVPLLKYRLGAGSELELELLALSSLSLQSELEPVDSESLFTFFPTSLHAFLRAFFFAFFYLRLSLAFSARASRFKYCFPFFSRLRVMSHRSFAQSGSSFSQSAFISIN